MKKTIGRVRSVVEAQTIVALLYSYWDLSDAEIGPYLDFAESSSGKKYHAVVLSGMNNALAAAAHVLANEIEKKTACLI